MSELIFSKRFNKILKTIDDEISKKLLELNRIHSDVEETFIDVTEKDDTISFLPSDKVFPKDDEHCWSSSQRVEIRIGRYVNRLFENQFSSKELEDFVNHYKAVTQSKKLNKNFKIVEGEEIKKWYLQDNYSEGNGTLHRSCMRFRYTQSYLDLYVINSNKIKLLILLDESEEKILGRALLWKLDTPSGKIFMDRVYCSSDFVLVLFLRYAMKHGFYHRYENMNDITKVVYNGVLTELTMIVELKKIDYRYFPFVDNICYFDPESFILTNDLNYMKENKIKIYYDLCDTLGEYDKYEMKDDGKYIPFKN